MQQWLYNIFFFPLSIGYLHFSFFPAFLASTTTSNAQYYDSNAYLIAELRLFIAVFCSLVFFYEFKTYFTDKKEDTSTTIKHDVHYENVYLFFWLQIIAMLSVNCFYEFDWV